MKEKDKNILNSLDSSMEIEQLTQPILGSSLPTAKAEFSDGNTWAYLASENWVRVLVMDPVIAATTGITLSATYGAGVPAGVGATLTNSGTQGIFQLDGVTLAVGQRVLIKDQAASFQNGIYNVTNIGSASTNWLLTRSNTYDSAYLITQGGSVVIVKGAINYSSSYMQTNVVLAIGTDAINFTNLALAEIVTIIGTANQIVITGTSTNPIISIAPNPVIPGTGSITIPSGTTAQRPAPLPGAQFRLNTTPM